MCWYHYPGHLGPMILFAAFMALAMDRADSHRPNVLVLLTDDQDVALGGFKHMPQVQKYLVEEGTTFENAFVHTPICCPSRSTMLSGRYLHNGAARNNSISGNCDGNDWKKNVEPLTYAVHAQQAGYTTAYAGKYLNQYGILSSNKRDPNPRVPLGFDHWFGLVGNSRYYNYSIVESSDSGATVQIRRYGDSYQNDYLPDVLKNYTLNLITKLPEPWLMVVAWPTPHAPFTPAPWALDRYSNVVAPLTNNFNASSRYMQQKHWLMRQLPPITDNLKTEQIDTVYHQRLEALLSVDDHVGQLRKVLLQNQQPGDDSRNADGSGKPSSSLGSQLPSSTSSLWDRTVAIYTSDNGFQFGQHRLAIDKRHLYEFDIRVPLVIRGLGLFARNYTSKRLAVNIDLAPTIWDLVHYDAPLYNKNDVLSRQVSAQNTTSSAPPPLPEYLDGISLVPAGRRRQFHRLNKHIIYGKSKGQQNSCPGPSHRHDFLISYNGEGVPPCGLANCPMPPEGSLWYMPDSINNTYHCVRTLIMSPNVDDHMHSKSNNGDYNPYDSEVVQEDSIFCQFEDEEDFVEFYNLTTNPYQLDNDYETLSPPQVQRYKQRLRELQTCQGSSCRGCDASATSAE